MPPLDGGSRLPDGEPEGAAAPEVAPSRTKALARERVDAAVRSMMEGYAAIAEAAKISPPGEMAISSYAFSSHAAAMARAADQLLSVAGAVGSMAAVAEACYTYM